MNSNLVLLMIFSGLLFGAWPLIMNKSNLNGWTSALMLEVFACVIVAAVSGWKGISFAGTKWWLGVVAGIMGGMGILLFTAVLARTNPTSISRLLIINLLAQIAVPAVYGALVDGGLSLKTTLGLAAAVVATFLLV